MTIRFARHTDNLEALTEFYTTILGLSVLGEFNDHDGYDGVFLGIENKQWHLEFTRSDEKAQHSPDADDLLVFYPENPDQYNTILSRIEKKGIELLIPKNPYWRENGILIKDPDGFEVIVNIPG